MQHVFESTKKREQGSKSFLYNGNFHRPPLRVHISRRGYKNGQRIKTQSYHQF